MLSFQIKDEINKILASFEDAEYFFYCLEEINSTFNEMGVDPLKR